MRQINICSCFILSAFLWNSSIYDFSVTSIEGINKSLLTFEGKKIMVITLPTEINSANEAMLHSLDSLGDGNETSLKIIAVPSYEDGYTDARKEELKQWYRSFLDSSIVVTEGLHTRKTSGSQQAPLFHWLTDVSENEHFDIDVVGPWSKFMVRSNGELFGVLGDRTSIGGSTINHMLLTQ